MRSFLVLFILCLPLLGRAEPDFGRYKKHLGFATSGGCIEMWSEVPGVRLDKDTVLPVRWKFTSEPLAGVPLFGKFWWFPLVESTLVPRSEKSHQFTTLGGKLIPLRLGKEGDFASSDGRYKGRVVSPSESHVEGDGWLYRFVNGRLRSAKLPDGRELEWALDSSGRFRAITEKGRSDLLTFLYKGTERVPYALKVGSTEYGLEYQQVPVVKDVMGQALVAGYEPSLAKITQPGGREFFPIELDREGHYVMDYASDFFTARQYVWAAASGLLKSDGEWTYQLTPREKQPPMVSRHNAAGQVESYVYDPNTGISEHRQPDGKVTTRQYFVGRGPAFHKIRNLTMTGRNGRTIVSQQWSYDEVGRLIRERDGNTLREWIWRPNGEKASEIYSKNGKLVSETKYDEQGRVTERSSGRGTVVKFVYEQGKTVIQRFERDKIVFTQVIDAKNRQEFLFAEGGGSLVSRPAINGHSSGAVDSARALANHVLQNIVYGHKN